MNEECCANCKFSYNWRESIKCCRYPPSFYFPLDSLIEGSFEEQIRDSTRFPVLYGFNWCGEYKRRKVDETGN